MNRTYWALGLGCNVVVLDSVYCALDHCLFRQVPAYRWWKIIKTTDAVVQSTSPGKGIVVAGTLLDIQTVNAENYKQIFTEFFTVNWRFPTNASSLYVSRTRNCKFGYDLCLTWRQDDGGSYYSTTLLQSDGQDWLEHIPTVLRELQKHKP